MININNSTVTINICDDTTSQARDILLTKLYYARNKPTMGGYEAWQNLLNMYYMGNYAGMQKFIQSCRGKGGRTRNECLGLLEIIRKGERK